MITDASQRERALDPTRSFIVQAPAGSGKTELLTQRFLKLLSLAEKNPEEILAITFTKKAALEMRTRVLNALKNTNKLNETTHALAKAVLKRDQTLNWHLCENPHRLRIQTIDSFCHYLVRQLPLTAALSTTPTITQLPQPLYKTAAEKLLMEMEKTKENETAFASLLAHCDNDWLRIQYLLARMLEKRGQWLPHLMPLQNHQSLRAVLESGLQAILKDHLELCQTTFPRAFESEILHLTTFAHQNGAAIDPFDYETILLLLPEKQLTHWQQLKKWLLTEQDSPAFRKIVNKNMGFPSPKENPNEKEKYADFKKQMESLLKKLLPHEDFLNALAQASKTPPPTYHDTQWNTLAALLILLPKAVIQLKQVFQTAQAVDYTEIALAAQSALGASDAPTDLSLRLDYQIRHILVDEFQDTSIHQFELLKQLTAEWSPEENRTLFLVGDPMQSIYRFRNAEVGLFLRAKHEGLGHIQLEPIILSSNFRSTPRLIEWQNQMGETIFPAIEDIAAGVVAFTPSTAVLPATPKTGVYFHPLMNADETTEAQEICALILKTQAEDPSSSIAILVRARTHLASLIPLLREKQISYQAIEMDSLDQSPLILDILSLTKALLRPHDRVAWLSILRAPFCGLILADLEKIAESTLQKPIFLSLHQKNMIEKLSADGQKRVKAFYAVIERAFTERTQLPLRRFIEQTWNALQAPLCYETAHNQQDLQTYLQLLETLEKDGDIENLAHLESKIAEEFVTPAPSFIKMPPVQILTIHKAKGLEFDAVILCGLHRKTASYEMPLLRFMERPRLHETADLILGPIKNVSETEDAIQAYLNHEEHKKEAAENLRLLYVAVTRAKKQLHLIGCLESSEDQTAIKKPSGFLKQLWPLVEKEAVAALSKMPTQSAQISHAPSKKEHPLKRLKINHLPEVPLQLHMTPHISHQTLAMLKTENHEALIGTLVHRILYQISIDTLVKWPLSRLTDVEPTWRLALLRLGIPENEIKTALDLVLQAIRQTLSDERGQWILKERESAVSEFALSGTDTPANHKMIIDRFFIDEKGNAWIIDYKTTSLRGNSLNNFLAKEKERHQKQLKNYAERLKNWHAGNIHIGLYFPMIPAWVEWEDEST